MSHTGSCLCGDVTYTLTGPLRPSVACHCIQCRKTSGHYVSATQVPGDKLHITQDAGLSWYRSSPEAERGFCHKCGASLFWRHEGDNGAVSVMSGTIDGDTGITTAKHIFTAHKGDYYDIERGVPQRED
ncbi:MAG: GFA family protein [Pseudomonadota bacterium]